MSGPKGSLLLGALECVVVSRTLIILQVYLNGLGVEDIVHVICDGQGLTLADQSRYRAGQGTEQGHRSHEDNEKHHLSESHTFVGSRHPCGHRVHH